MFGGIKFPCFSMQQLNLDWLLENMAHYPKVVEAPPLSTDNNQSVYDVIDSTDVNTPHGFSFFVCGNTDDTANRRCCIMLWKIDFDNLYGVILSTSDNLRGKKCAKINGNWVMYT